jgi:predicted dehydrogenase
MKNKTRWGLVGSGYIAGAFAKALSFIPEAEAYAVGSRTQKSADAFAKTHHIPVAHGSYQDLIDDPNVDVIYIATLNSCHRENCLSAIDAGKPILCEKPFMVNSKEAIEVTNYAKEKNIFLMEALWTRFIPAFIKAREIWESGVIGELYSACSDIGFIYERNESHPLYNPSLAGGALLDLGAYPVSIAHIVFGEPESINAFSFIGPTGVDEQTSLIFGYKEGKSALGYSSFKVSPPMEATIMGTKGYIRLHSPFYCPPGFTLVLNEKEPQVFNIPYEGNGWNYEAIEVMNCLREGKLESDIVPHAETLSLMRTMDRIRSQIGLKFPIE